MDIREINKSILIGMIITAIYLSLFILGNLYDLVIRIVNFIKTKHDRN